MSAGRRISTWLAGRNTLTPISTSRPPLILRVTVPVTMSFSWTVSITFSQASIFSALRLLSDDHAARFFGAAEDVFDVFDQHLDDLAGLRRFFPFVPFVERDGAFALVADVDQHEVAFDAEHAPFDDLVERDIAAAPVDFVGVGAAQGGGQFLFPFFLLRSSPRIRFRLTMRKEKDCSARP